MVAHMDLYTGWLGWALHAMAPLEVFGTAASAGSIWD